MTIVRISGVNIPVDKRVVIAMTYIVGVGRSTSQKILKECKIDENIRVKDLTETQINAIRSKIDVIPTEADLRRQVGMDIKRLQEIGSYRGLRHRKGLPTRGQRTKTNARTRKGKIKTVANKKG